MCVCVCVFQCEQCLCWQHADCVGIDEEQPPEHYLCCICQSPHGMYLCVHVCPYDLRGVINSYL